MRRLSPPGLCALLITMCGVSGGCAVTWPEYRITNSTPYELHYIFNPSVVPTEFFYPVTPPHAYRSILAPGEALNTSNAPETHRAKPMDRGTPCVLFIRPVGSECVSAFYFHWPKDRLQWPSPRTIEVVPELSGGSGGSPPACSITIHAPRVLWERGDVNSPGVMKTYQTFWWNIGPEITSHN